MNNPDPLVVPLIAGFILDSILGDPKWFPHPVRFFGWLISKGEKRLNKSSNKRIKGTVLSIVLIFFVWVFLRIVYRHVSLDIGLILSSLLVFLGIANHGLIKESLKVIKELKRKGLDAGRRQLSLIVGRDTNNLSEDKIKIAVLETLSENLSDGVIAPLFYYFLGGIPLMFSYKMVNTLDSMIGHKNERYKQFGWFAARMDDFANYIPARLTALMMVILMFSRRGLKYIFIFGKKHVSPNAGFPEAALAGILNCRLGGPSSYDGKNIQKSYIGINERPIKDKDIIKTCLLNTIVTISFILVCLFLRFVYG